MPAPRQAVAADGAPAPAGPYSQGIRSGDLLFLAGQTPVDPATGLLAEGDLGEQTRQCLRNLQAVAQAAGGDLRDAVRCAVYVTDLDGFAEINAAYAEFFTDPLPARTTIEVAALPLGAPVEIDAIVALG